MPPGRASRSRRQSAGWRRTSPTTTERQTVSSSFGWLQAIAAFIAACRAEGIALPVKVGIPGVAEIPRLLSISARIGVKDASRFVLKNARFVGQLLRSGGTYRPTQLLRQLAPVLADPAADVMGLHVYTFNNVAATEAWREEERRSLGA